jgi:ferrous iron transport protein A
LKSLADLAVGEVAVVKNLAFNNTAYVKRLQALGLRLGVEIKVVRKGLTGSPIHVSIHTTELAIRQKDAENIHIF